MPKVYDSPRKPIFFSLFFFIFVSLLGLACWNLVNTSNLHGLCGSAAFDHLPVQPSSLQAGSLNLLSLTSCISLHLPFAGLSQNPVSLLSVTNLTHHFKSRCFGPIPHTLHGAGQSSMLIWFGGVGADRKGELLQNPLVRTQFGNSLLPK